MPARALSRLLLRACRARVAGGGCTTRTSAPSAIESGGLRITMSSPIDSRQDLDRGAEVAALGDALEVHAMLAADRGDLQALRRETTRYSTGRRKYGLRPAKLKCTSA